ncbi:MAG: response regulator [Vampirovibrionia bacterium]
MAKTTPIKVLLVEDHALMRIGMKHSITIDPDINIIGEASDGKLCIEMSEKLKPDLILMDIGLPIIDGIKATKHIKSNNPDIKIIMLTIKDEDKDIFASLKAGADAYCLKDIPPEKLIIAIKEVVAGNSWIDPSIADKVLKNINKLNNSTGNDNDEQNEYGLSDREIEVLTGIVDGLSNLDIGKRLNIAETTVKSHIRNILYKLSVEDRTQAAIKALKKGLVSYD